MALDAGHHKGLSLCPRFRVWSAGRRREDGGTGPGGRSGDELNSAVQRAAKNDSIASTSGRGQVRHWPKASLWRSVSGAVCPTSPASAASSSRRGRKCLKSCTSPHVVIALKAYRSRSPAVSLRKGLLAIRRRSSPVTHPQSQTVIACTSG